MKKYFALMLVVFTLALVGTAMAADSDSGHVIPITPDQPVTPTPGTDTGSDTTKTVDAPTAASTTTTTVTVSTVTQTTTTVTKVADTVTYTQKVVVTISKTEVTQTATQAVANKKVEVTTQTTTATTTVIETATGTAASASTVATQALAAIKQASGGSTTPATEAEAAADASKEAMIATLLAGNTTGSSTGSETVDLTLLTSLAEGDETPAETMLRVVNDAADTAARTNTATNTNTASTLTDALTASAGGTAQDVNVVDSTTLDVSDEEPPAIDDVMSLLAAQSAQEVSDATSGTAQEQQAAQARQRQNSTSTPVAVSRPVGLPRGATKPALVVSPMPTMKKDMYKKRINASAIKRRGAGHSSVTASALDASYSGSGVFLNSIGEVVDRVPGEGEWGTPKGETKRQLIVPGQVSLVMLMEPGVTYTPVITTPAEDVATIEGCATQQTQETVDVVKEETVTLTIPVYDTATYSTSFDETAEAALEAAGYNTAVAMYVVSGDAGAWSATSAADTAMLSSTGRAVALTLPKLDIRGSALPTDCYVMKVRYEIPVNTATQVISGDNLLDFYPRGLTTTNAAGETVVAATGTAVYLDTDMNAITDATIRAVAAKQAGKEISSSSWGYDGYIAMTLDSLGNGEAPYTPVVTVKTTKVESTTPGGDTPGGDTPTPVNPVNPGSSGGGCDAGFSVLALAVLGGFMVTRRK